MKVEQTKKAFVPVTITLETEKEVNLLKETLSWVDKHSMELLESELDYKIVENVTVNDVDSFSGELFYELKDIIN